MTVEDLIHTLTQACETYDLNQADVEVQVAFAQFNPLKCEIDAGPDIVVTEIQNDKYERLDRVIFLPVQSTGYLPRVAEVALGWKEDPDA